MSMPNRRTFLGLAAALLPISPVGIDAQTPASPRPGGELARHALTGPLEGFEVVLVEVSVPAGAGTGRAHRHPGPVLGYVLDGKLRFGINQESEQVVSAGGTFFEPSGALHTTNGSATPDAPARFLAFLVVPKGSPVVAPA
jgi:quercetin dioxygenase-like cupin family protein